MPRMTVSISAEDKELVEQKSGDSGEYDSKSAFIRSCIHRYEKADELEATVNELRGQLQAVNQREDDVSELADYIDRERQLQREERERRHAPLWDRIRWYVLGGPD